VLSAVTTLQDAVNTIVKILGLGAANLSENVPEGTHLHTLLCSGRHPSLLVLRSVVQFFPLYRNLQRRRRDSCAGQAGAFRRRHAQSDGAQHGPGRGGADNGGHWIRQRAMQEPPLVPACCERNLNSLRNYETESYA